jgi:hypothetical protein
MLKIKQYFCRHNFELYAKHGSSSQNLWKCTKCHVYCIQHYGIGVHYLHKTPHITGWLVNMPPSVTELGNVRRGKHVQNR